MMDDEALLTQFEARTLPLAQWTHRAHLRVAYLYVRRYGPEEATERMRVGIQRFNAANEIPEAIDRGYHETITRAWLRLIHAALGLECRDRGSVDFLDAHPDLGEKRTLLRFYSRERIMSWEAKREFVEPDLAPLP
jgi:hypothetical protein